MSTYYHHTCGGRGALASSQTIINVGGVIALSHDLDVAAISFINQLVEAEFMPAISISTTYGKFEVNVDPFTAYCLRTLFPDGRVASSQLERLCCTDLDNALQIETTCAGHVIIVKKSIFSVLVEAFVLDCSKFELVWPMIKRTVEECCKSDVQQHVVKHCITIRSVSRLFAKVFSDVDEMQKQVEVLKCICSLQSVLKFDEPNEDGVSILSAISAWVNSPSLIENAMVTGIRVSSDVQSCINTNGEDRTSTTIKPFFDHELFKADSLLVRQAGLPPLMAMIMFDNYSLLTALLSKLKQDDMDMVAVFNTCCTVKVDVLQRYFDVAASVNNRLRHFALYDYVIRFSNRESDNPVLQLTPFIAAVTRGKFELVKELIGWPIISMPSLGICTLFALLDAVSSGAMNSQQVLNVIEWTKLDLASIRSEQQIGFSQYSIVRLAQRLPADELQWLVNELVTRGLDLAIVDKECMKGISIVHAFCLFSPETEIETLVAGLDPTLPIRMELIESSPIQGQQQSSTCSITLLHCAMLRCFIQSPMLETKSSEVAANRFDATKHCSAVFQSSAAYNLVFKLLEVYTQRPTINYAASTCLLRRLDTISGSNLQGSISGILGKKLTLSEISVAPVKVEPPWRKKLQEKSQRTTITVVAPLLHTIMRGNFLLAKELLKCGAKIDESLLCYLSSMITPTLENSDSVNSSIALRSHFDFADGLSKLPNTEAFDQISFLTLKQHSLMSNVHSVSGFCVPCEPGESFGLTELISAGVNVNARVHDQSVLYRIFTDIPSCSEGRLPVILHDFLRSAYVDVNVYNTFSDHLEIDNFLHIEEGASLNTESMAAASAGCYVGLDNDRQSSSVKLRETLLDYVLRCFVRHPEIKLRLVIKLLKYGAQVSPSGVTRLPERLLVPEYRLEELILRNALLSCGIRLPLPQCYGPQLQPTFHPLDVALYFTRRPILTNFFYSAFSVEACMEQLTMVARNKSGLEAALQNVRKARIIALLLVPDASLDVGLDATDGGEFDTISDNSTSRDQPRAPTIANLPMTVIINQHNRLSHEIPAHATFALRRLKETYELMHSQLENALQQPFKLWQLATFCIRAAIGSDIETRLNALNSNGNCLLYLPNAVRDQILLKHVLDR